MCYECFTVGFVFMSSRARLTELFSPLKNGKNALFLAFPDGGNLKQEF